MSIYDPLNIILNINKFFKNNYIFLTLSNINFINQIARLAQLVERQTFNLVVWGSSPQSGEYFFDIFKKSININKLYLK
jgi:hypothetical protein